MTLNTPSDSLADITRVLINNLYPIYMEQGKQLMSIDTKI